MNKSFLIAVSAAFLLLNAVFYFLDLGANYGVDDVALYAGNAILLLVSLLSYLMVSKSLKSNPQAFVRGVYGSTYLKLAVCIIGILIYALAKRPNVNKPTIFILLGIYAVYTIVETLFVSKLARKTK